MAEIIENKLGVQLDSAPVSGLTFVRLFYYIFRNAANELGLSEFYESAIILADLEQKMEILACDASCASIRTSELALVMLCTQMDASVSKLDAGANQIHGLVDYAIQLQKLCRVSVESFVLTHQLINDCFFLVSDSRQHVLSHSQHGRQDSLQLQRTAENAL